MTTYLYLDFDGVLHHEEVYATPKRGIHMREPGHALFEWVPILEDLLEPYLVEEVGIILSTSWVRERNFSYAKSRLSAALQVRVIGATFHNRHHTKQEFSQTPRGAQVMADALRRGAAANRWFALDDDDYLWPERSRGQLIKTDGATGLSDPAVQQAVRTRLETAHLEQRARIPIRQKP